MLIHNDSIDGEYRLFFVEKIFNRLKEPEIKFIVEQLRVIHGFENEE